MIAKMKVSPDMILITLMSIFDKGEMENVSDAYVKSLVDLIRNNPNP